MISIVSNSFGNLMFATLLMHVNEGKIRNLPCLGEITD